jgi:hypothetical protein
VSTPLPCPRCGEKLGGRYRHKGQWVCWPCTGLRPAAPRRPKTNRARQNADWLVGRLTEILGPPVATPEQISDGDGKLVPARYRMFRWRCPSCLGGYEDLDLIYRPFVVDTDGNVSCKAPHCSEEKLKATLIDLLARKS